MFNFFKKQTYGQEKWHFKRYRVVFTTIDGIWHIGATDNWVNEDNIVSNSVPEYIMSDIITEDGFLKDKETKRIYPLTSVLEINFQLLEERITVNLIKNKDGFLPSYHTDEMLNKLEPWFDEN